VRACRLEGKGSRYKKARRGELVVGAPVGVVKAGDRYEKDPDRRVQEAISLVFDKVLELGSGPDMIALLRPQPNARSVGQPEPAALGLLVGDLQPLTLPDTLDPLVVDYRARLAQERGDLAAAIAAVLPGKLDNIGGETLLIVTTARDLALRRAMLPERRTGATLGDMQLRSDLLKQARRRAGLRSFPEQPPAE
jgi:hypothetical protein